MTLWPASSLNGRASWKPELPVASTWQRDPPEKMEFVFALECDLSKQNLFFIRVSQKFKNLRINSVKYCAYEPIDSLCCISVNAVPNKKVCFQLESDNFSTTVLSLANHWNPIKITTDILQFELTDINGYPLRANCMLHLYIQLSVS